eukprot:m.9655 g.9655  ORF g.9655 m.9655 type:complete len:1036 (+) comp21531_c0_seq1:58-3165(+)
MRTTRVFVNCRVILGLGFLLLLHRAEGCPTKARTLTTQSDVDEFLRGCGDVVGDLVIGSCSTQARFSITNLASLNDTENISGRLAIQCTGITKLTGFGGLVKLGGLEIRNNLKLSDVSAFSKVQGINGSLSIVNNPNLQQLGGLQLLEDVQGYLQIDRNDKLVDFKGLSALKRINGTALIGEYYALSISLNSELKTLTGLAKLRWISRGTVRIMGNPHLCYAGYPQLGYKEYISRPTKNARDKGINWLGIINTGQNDLDFRWKWEDDGFVPTLLIQNNGDQEDDCKSSQCSSQCKNAGCYGNDVNNLCGVCTEIETGGLLTTCEDLGPSLLNSGWWPPFNMPYLAIFIAIIVIVILVVILIVIGCCYCCRKRQRERMGSFQLQPSESKDNLTYELESGLDDGGIAMQSIKPLESPTGEMPVYFDETEAAVADHLSEKELQRRQKEEKKRLKEEEKKLREEEKKRKKEIEKLEKERLKQEMTPQKKRASSLDENVLMQSGNLSESLLEDLTETQAEQRPAASHIQFNFPRDQLKLVNEIGFTETFKVHEGIGQRIVPGLKRTKVVIQELVNIEGKQDFLKDLERLWHMEQHPNILSLLALCTEIDPYLAVLEDCPQGNMKTYLMRHRWDASALQERRLFTRIATDLATGLSVLHENNFTHGDVATRNCQLAVDSSVKIGDYGLAKELFRDDYYLNEELGKLLPVRWMAPESLKMSADKSLEIQKLTKASEVWSFGVTLWEILSMAQKPYEALSNEEVVQSVIIDGTSGPLTNPSETGGDSGEIYAVAQACWLPPEIRPTMEKILEALESVTSTGEVPEPFRLQYDPEKHKPTRGPLGSPSRNDAVALPLPVEEARAAAMASSASPATSSPNIIPRQGQRLSSIKGGEGGGSRGSPPLTAAASAKKTAILEALQQNVAKEEEEKSLRSSLRSPDKGPKPPKKKVSFNEGNLSETFNISIVSLRSQDEEEEEDTGNLTAASGQPDTGSGFDYHSDTLQRKKRENSPVKATDLDSLQGDESVQKESPDKPGDNASALIW